MLGQPELWRENGGGRRAAVRRRRRHESRRRAPSPGEERPESQRRVARSPCSCAGRSDMAKPKRYSPLQGKRFYLDVQNQRQATHLERELQQLGGTVERFLSRDVNYLITSRKEVATDSSGRPAAAAVAAPVEGPLTPSSKSTTLGPGKVGSAPASLPVALTPQVTSGGPKAPIGVPNDARPTTSSTMNRTQTAQALTAKRCAFIERPTKEVPETYAVGESKQWQHAKILHNFINAVKIRKSQSTPQLGNGYRTGIKGSDVRASATASQHQQQHKHQLVPQQQKTLHLPALLVSRGKKLAQKAMKRQENVGADLLANARSWGVKIIHMDAALQYLEKKRLEAKNSPQPGPHVQPVPQPQSATQKHIGSIKLQKPFVKVEDCSQLYRPMFVQLGCVPWLNTASLRGTCPFELEILPAGPSQQQPQEQKPQQQDLQIKQQKQPQLNQPQLLVGGQKRTETNAGTKAADVPRVQDGGSKRTGVPCRAPLEHVQSHMQNECHRSFASDDANYVELDTLIHQLEKRNSASPTATMGSVTPESSRPTQVYQREINRPSHCADTGVAQTATLYVRSCGNKEVTDAASVERMERSHHATFATKLPCSPPSQRNLSNDSMPVLSPCTLEESFSVLSHNNLEPPQLRAERVSGTTNVATSCQATVAEHFPRRSKKRKGKFSTDPPSKVARIGDSETEEGATVMSTWNPGVGDTGCTAMDAAHSQRVGGCTDGGEALGHSMPTVDRTWLNGAEVQAEVPWWERNSALEGTDEGGIPGHLQLLQLFRTSEMGSFDGFHFDEDGAQEQAVESRGCPQNNQGGPTLQIAQGSGDNQESTHRAGSGLPGDAATHSGATDGTVRTRAGNRTPTTGAGNDTTVLCERERQSGRDGGGQSDSGCLATTAQATAGGDANQLQGAVVASESSTEWDHQLFRLEEQQKRNGLYHNLCDDHVDMPDLDYQAHLDTVLAATFSPK